MHVPGPLLSLDIMGLAAPPCSASALQTINGIVE